MRRTRLQGSFCKGFQPFEQRFVVIRRVLSEQPNNILKNIIVKAPAPYEELLSHNGPFKTKRYRLPRAPASSTAESVSLEEDFTPSLTAEKTAIQGVLNMTLPERTAISTIPSLQPFSPSVQSTQHDDMSLNLTVEDLELIKKQLSARGKFTHSQEISYNWLLDNVNILYCLIPHSGDNLEHLLGQEYIYVKDALSALDLLVQYGIITKKELDSSDDVKLLAASHNFDRLTFHSLANVVRNIVTERS